MYVCAAAGCCIIVTMAAEIYHRRVYASGGRLCNKAANLIKNIQSKGSIENHQIIIP